MRIFIVVILSFFINQSIYGQFEIDRHSTNYFDAWISCEQSPCPDQKWGDRHWIMYQFEAIYTLGQMKIWNYNDRDNNGGGVRDVMIEYSIDGEDWIEWGLFEFEKAKESSFYMGTEGPNLEGVDAKYLLLTVISNHGGGSCVGIGEVKIETEGWSANVTKQEIKKIGVEISPNPVSKTTVLSMDLEDISPIDITIIDQSGKRIEQIKHKPEANYSELELDVDSFYAGTYFVYLRQNNKLAHCQLVVIK